VSIIIVSKRRIQQMNLHYRQINQPTDVLTFPGDELYLGDIVICYDVAVKKANEFNQTVENYMRFCIVHGLLHAIGYDHQTNESYDEMMDLQEQVIQRRTP
jgi:probable rRNA maturation factor